MSVRIATFNIENLMNRFDFSGFRNELRRDRAVSLFEVADEAQYRQLESARMVSHSDDARQLSALAIYDCDADILCLQEIDNIEALRAFEHGYLYRMIGEGYLNKYATHGNDTRGIDVAVCFRPETRHGEPIEFVALTSHAHNTYEMLDVFDPALAAVGEKPGDRVFRRDCLEIDLRIGGRPITVYVVHFKSMGSARDGVPGREWTLPIRRAEARAVRRIIQNRFGAGNAAGRRWIVCGDFNDYRERIVVGGDRRNGYTFEHAVEEQCCLDELLSEGFAHDVGERLPPMERWTLYHTRGPQERHLCQLDHILLSPSLARTNPVVVPEIVRAGQPYRTIFPPGQSAERYPRTGWDRPKASDHCPVAITLDIV